MPYASGNAVNILAPTLPLSTIHSCRFSNQATKTRQQDEQRRAEAVARLAAAVDKKIQQHEPRSRWIGKAYQGAIPIFTGVRQFHPDTLINGTHLLDLFGGIMCGGLRVILSTGKKVALYTSVEIPDVS